MFAILWFLFIALAIVVVLVWLLDHNGEVLITWLGYEAQTDVLTAILISTLIALLIFSFSYLMARILAIKFPALLKLLFRRSYVKLLEKLVHRHNQAFETIGELLFALEAGDEKSAEKLQKKYSKLTKNRTLKNFFAGKIYFQNSHFAKAAECFLKLNENRHAKILALKAKFFTSLAQNDDIKAMAYGKQILTVKYGNLDVAKIMFMLANKHGLRQDAEELISEYGIDKLRSENGIIKTRSANFFKKIFRL